MTQRRAIAPRVAIMLSLLVAFGGGCGLGDRVPIEEQLTAAQEQLVAARRQAAQLQEQLRSSQERRAAASAGDQLRDTYLRYLNNIAAKLEEATASEVQLWQVVPGAEYHAGSESQGFNIVEIEASLELIQRRLQESRELETNLKALIASRPGQDGQQAAHLSESDGAAGAFPLDGLGPVAAAMSMQLRAKEASIAVLQSRVEALSTSIRNLETANREISEENRQLGTENRQVSEENRQLRDLLSGWLLARPGRELNKLVTAGALTRVRGTYAPSGALLAKRGYEHLFHRLSPEERVRVPLLVGTKGAKVVSVHRLEEGLCNFARSGKAGVPFVLVSRPEEFWALSPFLILDVEL